MHQVTSFRDIATGLPGLELRLQRDLAFVCWPGVTWMPERLHNGTRVMHVAIIGAG